MTICLAMIVKNEAHVIRRALASVRDHVDYWVICDTGSSDGTEGVILSALAGIPGELHSTTWVDFGHNRSEALALARDKADYVLIMDADMVANVKAPFKHLLTADAYEIRYEGESDYSQPMLVANRHAWRFVGVTHEHIFAETAGPIAFLPQLTLTHIGDGGSRSDKFDRDLRLLAAEIERRPDDPRTAFYLAQTYRDLRRDGEALEWYRLRAALETGWDEERFVAQFEAARARERLGHPWPEVRDEYLTAYAMRPWRFEPLHAIVRHYARAEEYALGYLYGAFAREPLPYPNDRLFIDRAIYTYGLVLEFGICAFGTGRIDDARSAFERVLAADPPPAARAGAERGLELCEETLAGRRSEETAGAC